MRMLPADLACADTTPDAASLTFDIGRPMETRLTKVLLVDIPRSLGYIWRNLDPAFKDSLDDGIVGAIDEREFYIIYIPAFSQRRGLCIC